MKLAILSCAPNAYSTRRLKEAAEQRNQKVDVLNTLKFAARAKKMKNKPIINDVNVSGGSVSAEDLPLLKKYRDEIEALRREKEKLEHLNAAQQEELENEKGQLEEMKTAMMQKMANYQVTRPRAAKAPQGKGRVFLLA